MLTIIYNNVREVEKNCVNIVKEQKIITYNAFASLLWWIIVYYT